MSRTFLTLLLCLPLTAIAQCSLYLVGNNQPLQEVCAASGSDAYPVDITAVSGDSVLISNLYNNAGTVYATLDCPSRILTIAPQADGGPFPLQLAGAGSWTIDGTQINVRYFAIDLADE